MKVGITEYFKTWSWWNYNECIPREKEELKFRSEYFLEVI